MFVRTIFIDPSTTCTGWAIADADNIDAQFIESGFIKPNGEWMQRAFVTVRALSAVILKFNVDEAVIEIPQIQGGASAANNSGSVLKMAYTAGMIYWMCLSECHGRKALPFTPMQWKKNVPKPRTWRRFSVHWGRDIPRVEDEADACALMDWWLRRKQKLNILKGK